MTGASDPTAWIEKARTDARAARHLLGDPPETEAAAYHVQQAAEKAIKAPLVAAGIAYPRGRGGGHDLDTLVRSVPIADRLHPQARILADLTPWATAFRYPADDPLTAQPVPEAAEIGRSLADVEALIEALAGRLPPVG